MVLYRKFACLAVLVSVVVAQFPTKPEGLTTIESKLQSGVSIDYKQTFICETTPGVKSFSGYVRLPASLLQGIADYNINTFFWYFEARHNPSTAPLAIYLAGGPGESSIYSALSSESGPCYANADGKSTTINPWSFNNHVNVLYIDQPVQTGFSYDTLVNGTYDVLSNAVTPVPQAQLHTVETNSSYGLGTFASQNPLTTTNTTVTTAKALWHFAENWLTSFPEFKSSSKEISVWTNSYGGYWGPAVVSYFQKQIAATPKSSPLHAMSMKTLGMTNACIDQLYSGPEYPVFAYNNSYGVHFIPESVYEDEVHNMTKPDGCADLIKQCRELGNIGDPNWTGTNTTVNEACNLATDWCTAYVTGGLPSITNRTLFDVAVVRTDGNDPCPFYLPAQNYLNLAHVQAALGVPVNFTYDSNVVTLVFGSYNAPSLTVGTGDSIRKGIHDLEYAITAGVNVTLVYGDRDYICNWFGGEAIAKNLAWTHQKGFLTAGYEQTVTNATYHGGVTKQFGKLSFTRVFDAGHAVSAYQPETVYRVFMRSMFGTDVATGRKKVGDLYATTGPKDSLKWRNVLPKSPESCMVEGKFQDVNVWTSVQSGSG